MFRSGLSEESREMAGGCPERKRWLEGYAANEKEKGKGVLLVRTEQEQRIAYGSLCSS